MYDVRSLSGLESGIRRDDAHCTYRFTPVVDWLAGPARRGAQVGLSCT